MSGYTIIDCKGLDLTLQTKQDIVGIYDQAKNAFDADKLCLAENCVYGDLGHMTPVAVMVNSDGNEGYVATSSILQIYITSDDKAQVVSLLA